jgi:hypothetical protein
MVKGRSVLVGAILFIVAGGLSAAGFMDIRPSMAEYSAPSGKSLKGQFLIFNASSETLPVHIEIQDGWKSQIGRPSAVPPEEWLHLKIPKNLSVRPGRNVKIPYKIRVPSQVSGEVLAFVFFSGPPQEGPNQNVGIQLRQAIPIYLSVRGTERAALSVASATAGTGSAGELELFTNISLDGNAHIRPRGEWVVSDFFGTELDRFPLSYGMPIFPGARRDYTARSKKTDWSPGNYSARLTVNYGDLWGAPQSFEKSFSLAISDQKRVLSEGVPGAP